MKAFRDEVVLFGERLRVDRLPCGLGIAVLEKPGFARAYASFGVRYGSFDRTFVMPGGGAARTVPDGIAHFLEHKLFESREGNALEAFSRRGAAVNAGTSHHFTHYHFTCADGFEDNLRLLMDFVRTPHFTVENVAKEQGIIGQEIRMYDDDPDDARIRCILGALFAAHPVAAHIAGTEASIARITPSLLDDCYEAFYRPENMFLCAVGDLDGARVRDLAAREAARMPAWCARGGAPRRAGYAEPAARAEALRVRRMPVGVPKIAVGFKEVCTPAGGEALLRRDISAEVLVEMLFGRGSDLYRSMYDDGIIDDSFHVLAGITPDIGFVLAAVDTPAPGAFAARVRACAETAAAALGAEDFRRVRRKLEGAFLKSFNTVESMGAACMLFQLNDFTLADVWRVLREVTLDDVRARAGELLRADACAVGAILPHGWEGDIAG